MSNKYTNRTTSHGSAISDFLVSMLFFAPFFAAFTLIGKLSDVEHAAQQEARYAAWERTVNTAGVKSEEALENESKNRIIKQQAYIDSALDKKPQGKDYDPDRTIWAMNIPQGEGERQSLVSFEKKGNALSTQSAGEIGLANEYLKFITTGMNDLEREGLYKGESEFAINEVSALKIKGKINCGTGELESYLSCIKRHNTLLTDDWSASSPEQVTVRVRERMPYSLEAWEPIAKGLDALQKGVGKPMGLLTGYNPFADLKYVDDAPGYVVPDLVPPSRLGNYDNEEFNESLDK